MSGKPSDNSYSEQEIVQRRESALKRMLSTPPQPHKPLGKSKRKQRGVKKAKPSR